MQQQFVLFPLGGSGIFPYTYFKMPTFISPLAKKKACIFFLGVGCLVFSQRVPFKIIFIEKAPAIFLSVSLGLLDH